MDINKQVCSFELAKKLKDLGIEQDSLWYISENENYIISQEQYYEFEERIESIGKCEDFYSEKFYSAFTVAELGEMLPQVIKNKKNNDYWESAYLIQKKKDETWEIYYHPYSHPCSVYFRSLLRIKIKPELQYDHIIRSFTEANARAKMLISLIEDNIISIA
ncbi:MAG: hypothetical protein ACFFE4_00405 [Candidatus Thorarchaeota archaeon]